MLRSKAVLLFLVFYLPLVAYLAVNHADTYEGTNQPKPETNEHENAYYAWYTETWTVDQLPEFVVDDNQPEEEPVEEFVDRDIPREDEKPPPAGKVTPKPPTLTSVYPLPANSLYTYEQMVGEISSLKETYPDLIKVGSIGSSVMDRPLWMVTLGNGPRKVLLIGACHAREWLTTALLMDTIEEYSQAYYSGAPVNGYPAREILEQYTLVYVPMQNPDGVILAQRGLAAYPKGMHEQLLSMKPAWDDNFTRWKANINGVDLNRQHDAHWELHVQNHPGVADRPWFQFYPGKKPESEPESKALANLIRSNSFELILTYHSTGNIYFWYYYQDQYSQANFKRDKSIVQAMGDYSDYDIYPERHLQERLPNRFWGATMTAWVVGVKRLPCITVEIGAYTNTYLSMQDLPGIWTRTRALPLVAVSALPAHESSFTVTCNAKPAAGGETSEGGELPVAATTVMAPLPQ